MLARLDHRRAPDIVRAAQQLHLLEAIPGARDTDVQFSDQLFQEFFGGPRAGGTAGAGANPSGVAGSGDRAGRARAARHAGRGERLPELPATGWQETTQVGGGDDGTRTASCGI